MELLRGVEYYHQIDPLYRAGEVIEVLDEDHDILWCRYAFTIESVNQSPKIFMINQKIFCWCVYYFG